MTGRGGACLLERGVWGSMVTMLRVRLHTYTPILYNCGSFLLSITTAKMFTQHHVFRKLAAASQQIHLGQQASHTPHHRHFTLMIMNCITKKRNQGVFANRVCRGRKHGRIETGGTHCFTLPHNWHPALQAASPNLFTTPLLLYFNVGDTKWRICSASGWDQDGSFFTGRVGAENGDVD